MKEIKEHDGWETVAVAGSTVGKNGGRVGRGGHFEPETQKTKPNWTQRTWIVGLFGFRDSGSV
jgi:hypothetical protein